MVQRNVPWGLLAEFVDPIRRQSHPGLPGPPCFFRLWRFHQVVHVNVKIVVEFDEIDGGLGLHLVYDHASPFGAILFGVLHLLADEAVHHFSGLTLRGGRIVWKRKGKTKLHAKNSQMEIGVTVSLECYRLQHIAWPFDLTLWPSGIFWQHLSSSILWNI